MATIPSIAVTIAEKQRQIDRTFSNIQSVRTADIGRVEKGKIWLDLRSVADFKALLDTVEKL